MEYSRVGHVPAPARWSMAGGFAIALVVASMLHAPAEPFARHGPLGLWGLDKWVHVGSYALLAVLLAYATLARTPKVLAGIAVATILFGGFVELLQGTVPWRTMEFADVVANSAGAVTVLVAWQVVTPGR